MSACKTTSVSIADSLLPAGHSAPAFGLIGGRPERPQMNLAEKKINNFLNWTQGVLCIARVTVLSASSVILWPTFGQNPHCKPSLGRCQWTAALWLQCSPAHFHLDKPSGDQSTQTQWTMHFWAETFMSLPSKTHGPCSGLPQRTASQQQCDSPSSVALYEHNRIKIYKCTYLHIYTLTHFLFFKFRFRKFL